MPMKPLAGVLLALACVLGIAATGSVFELAYPRPLAQPDSLPWVWRPCSCSLPLAVACRRAASPCLGPGSWTRAASWW